MMVQKTTTDGAAAAATGKDTLNNTCRVDAKQIKKYFKIDTWSSHPNETSVFFFIQNNYLMFKSRLLWIFQVFWVTIKYNKVLQRQLQTRASPRKENTRHSRKHRVLPGSVGSSTSTPGQWDPQTRGRSEPRSHRKHPTVLTFRLDGEDTASPQTDCVDEMRYLMKGTQKGL